MSSPSKDAVAAKICIAIHVLLLVTSIFAGCWRFLVIIAIAFMAPSFIAGFLGSFIRRRFKGESLDAASTGWVWIACAVAAAALPLAFFFDVSTGACFK